jgi:hypothetical protein
MGLSVSKGTIQKKFYENGIFTRKEVEFMIEQRYNVDNESANTNSFFKLGKDQYVIRRRMYPQYQQYSAFKYLKKLPLSEDDFSVLVSELGKSVNFLRTLYQKRGSNYISNVSMLADTLSESQKQAIMYFGSLYFPADLYSSLPNKLQTMYVLNQIPGLKPHYKLVKTNESIHDFFQTHLEIVELKEFLCYSNRAYYTETEIFISMPIRLVDLFSNVPVILYQQKQDRDPAFDKYFY